jgi:CBS domain-containing protein
MTVGDICTRPAISAGPDDTILEAARRMRDHHIGDLVVADAQGRPIGILTDRDIVVSAVAQSPDRIDALSVGDVMTRNLATTTTSDAVDDALRKMRGYGVRRLPVVSPDGRLEGVLAADDVLEFISDELGELVRLIAREQTRERVVRP